MIEIYDMTFNRLPYDAIRGNDITRIGACGFGCVLVKKRVFEAVGYPQFVYKQALDHAHTFSEDLDFCSKALSKGFEIFVDPTILCGHIGQRVFTVS